MDTDQKIEVRIRLIGTNAPASMPTGAVNDSNIQDSDGASGAIGKGFDDATGFVPIARRWVIARTHAWINRCEGFAKDWKTIIASSEAWFIPALWSYVLSRFFSPNWIPLRRNEFWISLKVLPSGAKHDISSFAPGVSQRRETQNRTFYRSAQRLR